MSLSLRHSCFLVKVMMVMLRAPTPFCSSWEAIIARRFSNHPWMHLQLYMRSREPRISVRPLVEVVIGIMILASETTDAIHSPIWATPTNCPPMFLAHPIRITFVPPQSRFFMNVKFKYLLSLLQLPIIFTCYIYKWVT